MEVRLSPEAIAVGQGSQFKSERSLNGNIYMLRFNPDGFVSPSSPETIVFRQKDNGELWVAQSRNRLSYEIQAGKTVTSR